MMKGKPICFWPFHAPITPLEEQQELERLYDGVKGTIYSLDPLFVLGSVAYPFKEF